jgi:acetylornithine/succinyldiaminopimelate/putrescine aminotransferase
MAAVDELCIVRGSNELLFSASGDPYIDLFAGSGTVLLGHAQPAIAAAITEQLARVWNTGLLRTPVRDEATAAIESYFDPTYHLAALYSTGMEAAEFALRVARVTTGRPGVVGFDRSMHGKSLATASLGWANTLATLPDVHRLPAVPDVEEDEILSRLEGVLSASAIAAVFLEPLKGSAGGYVASASFCQQVARLCRAHGTLLVMDEIFTGFYRAGAPFLFERFSITPDIVLIGKAMGNGFPVSGVVAQRRIPIVNAMLPNSTYAGNALAAAAIAATLREFRRMDLPAAIAAIEHSITSALEPLRQAGVGVRGVGALWVLELPRPWLSTATAEMFERRVIVSTTDCYLRLLPPATIGLNYLHDALTVVCEAILHARERSSR